MRLLGRQNSLIAAAALAAALGCGRQPPAAAAQASENPFPDAKPAPSLDGGVAWINTGGPDQAIDLRELRGKFVILDFWTYCCINCMHVLPELKKLEKAYPNEIVVIGVHSAKFDAEKDSQNIQEAVMRYEIEHPVVNDANHVLWRKYFVNSWPSFRVIDPRGNYVAGASGELTFEAMKGFLDSNLPYYRENGLLDETPIHFNLAAHSASETPLEYPGKVLADAENQRLFISDSNHNRIVVTSFTGDLIDVIGSGRMGAADGDFASAEFDHPQGTALDGDVLYVADTENHLIRKVDLAARRVSTIAGVGEQARGQGPSAGPPEATPLNSPWALWLHGGDLYVAMAGPHQIWKLDFDAPRIGPYAGNGREDIVDGQLLPRTPYGAGSSFAQPSGLSSDGERLFVADSEGSSIRSVPFNPRGRVETVLGTSELRSARLFTFGDVDGPFSEALLQHALEVVYVDGVLYVADTYNDKIKALDLAAKEVRTLTGGTGANGSKLLDEPAGLAYADGKLFIADTNAHRIRIYDLASDDLYTLHIKGLTAPDLAPRESPTTIGAQFADMKPIDLPAQKVRSADGKIVFSGRLRLPVGVKVNDLAPMRVQIAVADGGSVAAVLDAPVSSVAVDPPASEFTVTASAPSSGRGAVAVALNYYTCNEASGGLCRVGRVVWRAPIVVAEDGAEAVQASLDVLP